MVRKIPDKVDLQQLAQDLVKYRQRALELGATDAKIITSGEVLIDERVLAKCVYPKCGGYGTSANCPPHAMDTGLVRKVVNNFHYAIFTRIEVPSEEFAGDATKARRLPVRSQMKNYLIVSKIESEAFYDGYHLALGFAGGPCKTAFCPDEECSALLPGKACRHSLRARSAMEAVGMDAFTMAAKVGWDIYPIGESVSPVDIPHGTRLGLVLIY
jgi:predicted metal-binding protein